MLAEHGATAAVLAKLLTLTPALALALILAQP